MAMYDTSGGGTNWEDVYNRGGVTGTTQPATPYDPNAETTQTDWSGVLNRGGATGTTTPPPVTPSPYPAPTTQPANSRNTGIADAYQKYLGRTISGDEYQYWQNVPDYEQQIARSQEAQQYASRPQTQAAPSGAPGSLPWVQQQLARYKSTDDPNYWVRVMAADPKVAAGDQSALDYWLMRMSIGDGSEAVRTGQAKPYDHGPSWGGGSAGAGGPLAFSDPATAQWEQIVRTLSERLQNPTPDATKELQQTQALDPLERQRQSMKQQESLRLSQRGIQPGSGVYDDAMRNIDRQFNELRTRTQAGFANTAAQNDENRMMQAANLFKQIPQYQDARLALAQNTMIPTNVGSLLQLQQQGNQYGQMQDQAFWTNLANAIANMFNQ